KPKTSIDMEFPKLLLHIGLILATVTDLCVADDPGHIHRLPTNSRPVDYHIKLTIPDLEKSNTYHGETKITMRIEHKSFNISLHSQGLEINETATTLMNGTITYKPTIHTYDHKTNILSLHFEKQLYYGSYTLNMKFAGNFSQTGFGNGGFIKIPYTDEDEHKTYNRTEVIKSGVQMKIAFDPFRSMDLFVTGAMHHALHLDDGLLGSVTLNLYYNDTLDNQLFVDQVLEKAPAILRMLHHAVGDEVFRNGITKYFAINEYMAVIPDDFWSAIQSAKDEASYVPSMRDQKFRIKDVMDTWIVQNRYPVLNVTMNYHTGELTITQKCFHATEDINNKWWIPISYTDENFPDFSNTAPISWLKPDDEILRVQINPLVAIGHGWIIVNLQQTVYCRVYYDTGIYERIIPYLGSQEHTKIHVLNRAQIIDDAYAFLLEDQLDSYIFIDLITYYKLERDYVAWRPMFQILKRNQKYFSLPESKGFKLYMVEIFDGVLQHVGYEENVYDYDFTKLLRLDATKWACTVGHEECKRSAAGSTMVARLDVLLWIGGS
ncbi:Uncharacterized protein DBV15_02290, partial [Temnothorax longispinosus]